LKQLTLSAIARRRWRMFVTKPTMLFRLLFSFQRPSRRLLSLRQTRQST